MNAIKKQRKATNHILNAHNQALSYNCIVNIIKDISHHINHETICGFDSHLITLLKYIKYDKNVKNPDKIKNK